MKIHTSNIDTVRVMSHRQNPSLTKSEWQELYTNCVMTGYDYGYTFNSALSEIVSLVSHVVDVFITVQIWITGRFAYKSIRPHRGCFAYTTEVVSPTRSESIRLH